MQDPDSRREMGGNEKYLRAVNMNVELKVTNEEEKQITRLDLNVRSYLVMIET